MDEAWSPVTNQLLHLTMEIISLLTGEDYVVVRKCEGDQTSRRPGRTQNPIVVPSSFLIPLRINEKKILQIINRMINLLTGEGASDGGIISSTDIAGGQLSPITHDNTKAKSAGGKSYSPAHSSACQKNELSPKCKAAMTVKVVMKAERRSGDVAELPCSNCSVEKEDRPPYAEVTQSSSRDPTKESSPTGQGDSNTDVYSTAELGSISVKEEPEIFEIRHLIMEQGENLGTSPRGQQTTDPTFSCSRCIKSFDNHYDLLNHHHLACSECGRCFAYKSQLIFHMRSHTGEKPFTCSICRKSFASSGVLIRHQITHTGEKLYSCADCKKCFGSKSDLLIHQRIHTGLKPYACADCGSTFTTTSSLARHRRIHTGEKPFPCSLCKKSFVNSSDLVNHQRNHTGERPFSCPDCGKCFSGKYGLVKHQRTHCKQTRYSCPDCKVTFYAASKLKAHQKTHRSKS